MLQKIHFPIGLARPGRWKCGRRYRDSKRCCEDDEGKIGNMHVHCVDTEICLDLFRALCHLQSRSPGSA